jgi:hypothetical protein
MVKPKSQARKKASHLRSVSGQQPNRKRMPKAEQQWQRACHHLLTVMEAVAGSGDRTGTIGVVEDAFLSVGNLIRQHQQEVWVRTMRIRAESFAFEDNLSTCNTNASVLKLLELACQARARELLSQELQRSAASPNWSSAIRWLRHATEILGGMIAGHPNPSQLIGERWSSEFNAANTSHEPHAVSTSTEALIQVFRPKHEQLLNAAGELPRSYEKLAKHAGVKADSDARACIADLVEWGFLVRKKSGLYRGPLYQESLRVKIHRLRRLHR